LIWKFDDLKILIPVFKSPHPQILKLKECQFVTISGLANKLNTICGK
jgi:hypothetical protein